jgi:tellurite methyltransferase
MDKDYWEQFYTQADGGRRSPSLFARYCLNEHLEENMTVIELGCGRGADSEYFAAHGVAVSACDQSHHVEPMQSINPRFFAGDFTQLADIQAGVPEQVDIVYSRFSIHSVTAEDEDRVLGWVPELLKSGGKFLIEARSTKDDIYGKGECVGPHIYLLDDHRRRFIQADEFRQKLVDSGFKIDYLAEERGFAPYNDEDPICLRVVASLA